MGYTSVSDVELEWNRTVPDASLGHVARLIARAERFVTLALPNLAARIEAELASAEDVRDVVAAMVVRVLRNPDGKQAETAGDYSYQLASGASSGRLYMTADERRLLGGHRRAASMTLSDDALEHPFMLPPWVSCTREWTVSATGEAP